MGKLDKREKIILWGSGIKARQIMLYSIVTGGSFRIVGMIDNAPNAPSGAIGKHKIIRPQQLSELVFDKIVISTDRDFEVIKKQLIHDFNIQPCKIENSLYFSKKLLVAKYRKSKDEEIRHVIEYLQENPLQVLNYDFVKYYEEVKPEIGYDEQAGMYYVLHKNRPIYMAKRLNTPEKVAQYYRSISVEQDSRSPHAYLDEKFQIRKGDVILDAGVAEGNFSFEIIDKASKIYMVEADKEWIKALKYTFAAYEDKVVILNAFVSDYSADNTKKLDDLIHEPVNFIKMDVEGYEAQAFKGAARLIQDSKDLKCAICVYHNDHDEVMIKKMARNYGMTYTTTAGYMYFPLGKKQHYISPTLRRGILRCKKGESPSSPMM